MNPVKIFSFLLVLFSVAIIGCQNAGTPASSESSNTTTTTGTGGSMARFAIVNNTLYTLSSDKLYLFDISTSETPVQSSKILLGNAAETIFPYNRKLFFGTQTGLLIFDDSIPTKPTFISKYDHITSCDPVAVNGNYAYVTLRSGTRCWRGVNQLEIIDLKDLTNPILFNSFSMRNPHGLGIDNNILFLCDGDAGLKIYAVSSPGTLVILAEYPGVNTYDVIPNKTSLVMTGDSGIYQYDYSDMKNIHLISTIPVK